MGRRKNQLLKQIDPKSSWEEKRDFVNLGDFKDSEAFDFVYQILQDLNHMNTDLSAKKLDGLRAISDWAEMFGKRVIEAFLKGDVEFIRKMADSLEHIKSHQTGEGENWKLDATDPIRTEILKYVAIKKDKRGEPVWEKIQSYANTGAEWNTDAEKLEKMVQRCIDTEGSMERTYTIREILAYLKKNFPDLEYNRRTVVRIFKELGVKIDSRPGRPKKK